jgi:spore protease
VVSNKIRGIFIMEQFMVRTDLALEETERVKKSAKGQVNGIELEEYDLPNNIHISKVAIKSKNAAKNLGKPIGTYITIEAAELIEPDEDYHREISVQIAEQIKILIPDMDKEKSILVVGLGNSDVTADALGPYTIDNLCITRHIIKEYGKKAYNTTKINSISALTPGVMAKTGMETAEIIKGVINETEPDIVIVVDALAARTTRRLNRTIQITDTGIHPGSGVGNHRKAITEETMGVPVIAIGIPMVVDARTIVLDALGNLDIPIDNQLSNMYVTPKNIDETTKRLSFTVSEAINIALDMEE